MALSAKLQLRQSQSLVMTPQLMQSIRLLQLGHAELERFIDAEIEKNPLLERIGDDAPAAADAPAGDEAGDWSAQAMSDRLDTSLENVFPDDPGRNDAIAPDLAGQRAAARRPTSRRRPPRP
jgi:RNA polymerase sigma-54 factor